MRNKNNKGVRVTPTPSLQQLRGDLAVMPKEIFIQEYQCSDDKYNKYIEQFGAEELADFVYVLTEKILSNEIEVPARIRSLVVRQYQSRIIKLHLHEYEKRNFIVSPSIGYC